MKILKKISKVIVIVMAVLATIWCGLYVYANYFYNDKQISRPTKSPNSNGPIG
jgi:carboxyl-terminal processing protease